MLLSVRINGILSQAIGSTRVQVDLNENATVEDLISTLKTRYPDAAGSLEKAVPFAAGTHLSADSILTPNTQLALLMPVAGG